MKRGREGRGDPMGGGARRVIAKRTGVSLLAAGRPQLQQHPHMQSGPTMFP